MAGRHPVDHRQLGLTRGVEIGVPHRIAVDGRVIERRQIDRRHHILRQHPAERRHERHGFDVGDG